MQKLNNFINMTINKIIINNYNNPILLFLLLSRLFDFAAEIFAEMMKKNTKFVSKSLYAKVIYNICEDFQLDFYAMYACVGLWNTFFLMLYAVFDLSKLMKWCTRSTEEIFSLFISIAFAVDAGRDVIKNFQTHYYSPLCLNQLNRTDERQQLLQQFYQQAHVLAQSSNFQQLSRVLIESMWLPSFVQNVTGNAISSAMMMPIPSSSSAAFGLGLSSSQSSQAHFDYGEFNQSQATTATTTASIIHDLLSQRSMNSTMNSSMAATAAASASLPSLQQTPPINQNNWTDPFQLSGTQSMFSNYPTVTNQSFWNSNGTFVNQSVHYLNQEDHHLNHLINQSSSLPFSTPLMSSASSSQQPSMISSSTSTSSSLSSASSIPSASTASASTTVSGDVIHLTAANVSTLATTLASLIWSPEANRILQNWTSAALKLIFTDLNISEDGICRRETSLLFLLLMLGTVWMAVSLFNFNKTPYLQASKRELLADYALPCSVIILSFVGSFVFRDIPVEHFRYDEELQFKRARLEDLPWTAFGACMGLGFSLSLLFFMDQNISAAMVNNPCNKLKKGCAYHLDLFVVGILNGFLSLYAFPWMHGVLPHSPLHVRSLADVEERVDQGHVYEIIVKVRETRLTGIVSHILIGLSVFLIPYPMAYIPTAVLDGLFLYMAITSLNGNQMFERITLLFMEQVAYPPNHYIRRCPQRKIHLFTLCQMVQLGLMCFFGFSPWPYIKMVFPIIVILLLPFRHKIVPCVIDNKYLEALDGENQ
ncbi:rapamycin-insensitive companion of mTOR-like [Sarcoptes scabiei]|nr:rapamycin-insensitive companion of mTOR-like [Sarcoptes scabiei]